MIAAAPTRPPMRITPEALEAATAWGFNCGPGALCAVTGLTPAEVRPHLGDFEAKRYTNPTLMAAALRSLGIRYRRVYQHPADAGAPEREPPYPSFGLVRIQCDGPWCAPGVPVQARYRKTHWIAVHDTQPGNRATVPACCERGDCGRCAAEREAREVFDVNGVFGRGGWLSWREWSGQLVPWLLGECVPKASGRWWPTHCWEVLR